MSDTPEIVREWVANEYTMHQFGKLRSLALDRKCDMDEYDDKMQQSIVALYLLFAGKSNIAVSQW